MSSIGMSRLTINTIIVIIFLKVCSRAYYFIYVSPSERKCDHIFVLISHRLVYFVCVTKLHKGKEDNMGFGRGWGVLECGRSTRLQIASSQGRIFYKELESLLCPQLVQDMKELPRNSMAFLRSYNKEGKDMAFTITYQFCIVLL